MGCELSGIRQACDGATDVGGEKVTPRKLAYIPFDNGSEQSVTLSSP